MTWQAASFVVLGVVLLAGFAWYERSKPPSQVVAVVAALAALAVAGRVALAAVPNVVATTDIVLFAGFAFGAAPGFAVGALAGLVSNFWLGQGPWTPWQMAAWGLCGIAGAMLGRATGGDRPDLARHRLRCGGHRLRRDHELLADGHLRWRGDARAIPRPRVARGALRCRPCRRKRCARARRRPHDDPDA